ncbi:MAG: macro domain-containing protein [Deltaproteobacteria bacterium]|nr:macro domain-containing protein [Deltaproteobacteria bacterium]
MVTVRKGDLFRSSAQTIVNTVNCVGIMGKGLALEFKMRFPDMFVHYAGLCAQGRVRLGEPYLFKALVGPWILNFPTKGHWRSVSRLSDIVAGLEHLEEHYREWGITSLAVPALGSGNGGLEWAVVGPTVFRHLSRFDIPVELYAPLDVPDHESTSEFLSNDSDSALPFAMPSSDRKIPPALIALAEIVARIEAQPFHWPVGRVAFQKIAYFATMKGLPTGLEFRRGRYGPFCDSLKTVTTRLVNHGLLVEREHGKMIVVETGPAFPTARRLAETLLKSWSALLDDVADLLLRMKGREVEIAATVHFAAREARSNGAQPSEMDVLHAVKEWKVRRTPPIPESAFVESIRGLNVLGWVDLAFSRELPVESEAAFAD